MTGTNLFEMEAKTIDGNLLKKVYHLDAGLAHPYVGLWRITREIENY